jgi:guanine deaminase
MSGLVEDRSVFAHCVHSSENTLRRMARAGSAAAFCPSSNLLLGSGLFSLRQACACGVTVGLGAGAGASFYRPHVIGEAYKVSQLRGEGLDPMHAFHLATLGGAQALKLADRIGNLEPGKEADFLVLDTAATPLLARRMSAASTGEKLFVLSLIGDDRVIERTYLAGRLARSRDG